MALSNELFFPSESIGLWAKTSGCNGNTSSPEITKRYQNFFELGPFIKQKSHICDSTNYQYFVVCKILV